MPWRQERDRKPPFGFSIYEPSRTDGAKICHPGVAVPTDAWTAEQVSMGSGRSCGPFGSQAGSVYRAPEHAVGCRAVGRIRSRGRVRKTFRSAELLVRTAPRFRQVAPASRCSLPLLPLPVAPGSRCSPSTTGMSERYTIRRCPSPKRAVRWRLCANRRLAAPSASVWGGPGRKRCSGGRQPQPDSSFLGEAPGADGQEQHGTPGSLTKPGNLPNQKLIEATASQNGDGRFICFTLPSNAARQGKRHPETGRMIANCPARFFESQLELCARSNRLSRAVSSTRFAQYKIYRSDSWPASVSPNTARGKVDGDPIIRSNLNRHLDRETGRPGRTCKILIEGRVLLIRQVHWFVILRFATRQIQRATIPNLKTRMKTCLSRYLPALCWIAGDVSRLGDAIPYNRRTITRVRNHRSDIATGKHVVLVAGDEASYRTEDPCPMFAKILSANITDSNARLLFRSTRKRFVINPTRAQHPGAPARARTTAGFVHLTTRFRLLPG